MELMANSINGSRSITHHKSTMLCKLSALGGLRCCGGGKARSKAGLSAVEKLLALLTAPNIQIPTSRYSQVPASIIPTTLLDLCTHGLH
jgi:hypothetical protein